MCLGMTVMRWGVFWSTLRVPLKNLHLIIRACMKIHNNCLRTSEPILRNFNALSGRARTGDMTMHLQDIWDTDETTHRRRRDLEISSLRKILTDELAREGLKRPNRR